MNKFDVAGASFFGKRAQCVTLRRVPWSEPNFRIQKHNFWSLVWYIQIYIFLTQKRDAYSPCDAVGLQSVTFYATTALAGHNPANKPSSLFSLLFCFSNETTNTMLDLNDKEVEIFSLVFFKKKNQSTIRAVEKKTEWIDGAASMSSSRIFCTRRERRTDSLYRGVQDGFSSKCFTASSFHNDLRVHEPSSQITVKTDCRKHCLEGG